MAVKKIDDIYIDGKNRAWGGYIYSLSYNPSFGEAPSELTVEVTNESGIFDIGPEDLTTIGSPAVISIGTKIKIYMYPIEYQIEDSPSGKTLRVDYVDESIAYLDKTVVKLKTRGLKNQTETYINTIVIGTERTRNLAVTENTGNVLVGKQVREIGAGSGAEESTTVEETLSEQLQVKDVDYTFPELLAKLSFINSLPSLDQAASKYRRDYSGRLREVISAWCNDLALGFYWENRKLNFIDLRNPANVSTVRSLAESIRNANNVQSQNYGYSLRDTYTKGVEVFFGKDGEILEDSPDQNGNDVKGYTFTNIRLRNNFTDIIKEIVGDASQESLFNDRFKAAYYGRPAFLVNLVAKKPENSTANLSNFCQVSATVSQAIVDTVTNGTSVYTNRNRYKWYAIRFLPGGSQYFDQIFAAYQAYAKFYGRFYWKKFPTLERAQAIFGQEGRFYDEWLPISQVDIFKEYLEPLALYIKDYSELSLKGFIEGTGDKAKDAPTGPFDAPRNGYLIMEIQPIWTPKDSDFVLDLGKYALIEGGDTDGNFSYLDTTTNTRMPIFYFGVELGEFNNKKALNIQTPSEDPITFAGQRTGGIFLIDEGFADKIEYTTYSPPASANVNYCEFSSSILTEEEVLGASAFYYKNSQLTREAFNKAANDLILSTRTSQTEPFYSSSITIPNIDLAGSVPISLGAGLLGINVNIGAEGVQTTYKFGNEKMKIRSADVFYKYYYDSARKKQERIQVPSIIIRRGAARRVY